jgi:hypothetical protein
VCVSFFFCVCVCVCVCHKNHRISSNRDRICVGIMSSFVCGATLSELCVISREACQVLSDLIGPFYHSINSETSKLKADKSVFTIAGRNGMSAKKYLIC